jgi:hypothetical protein
MTSKRTVLFPLALAVALQALLMVAPTRLHAQRELRNVPWTNLTPEDRLFVKTLEIEGGTVTVQGGLMVVPIALGPKDLFSKSRMDNPGSTLKVGSGIGIYVESHSASTVWLTVQVNAPGEEKSFREDLELQPDYVAWRLWQPKNLQWNTPYQVVVTASSDKKHNSVLGTLNTSWVFPEDDRNRFQDAKNATEQALHDRKLVRFLISGWPEKASPQQLEAARKAKELKTKEQEKEVPPFEWKEDEGSPGVTLTASEKRRFSKQGSTWIEYDMRASGFQPGETLTLWTTWMDGKHGQFPFPISVDETGSLKMIYEGNPIPFNYSIGGMMAGEPISWALASADKRAYARAVVVPIESRGEGGCSGSVEMRSTSGLLFLVTLRGFAPGEDLEITNVIGKDKDTAKHHANDKGEAAFPAMFSIGDHGKATSTAAGKECKVVVDYKVGSDALVRR